VAINRLRWKDHRELALRGDDLIGIELKTGAPPQFLKGEAKSRAKLQNSTLDEARIALRKNRGRPSPHALSFIADRLYEIQEMQLVDAIDAAQLKDGIKSAQITHLLFTFSGNDPMNLLDGYLSSYSGTIRQIAVGLYVSSHQKFIGEVYSAAIKNGVHT